MYYTESKSDIVIIHNNTDKTGELTELVDVLFTDKIHQIYVFNDYAEAILSSEDISPNDKISLVLCVDEVGTTHSLFYLQKLHQLLPLAQMFFLTNSNSEIIEEIRAADYLYRYFFLPYDLTEFCNSLISAHNLYQQKFELNEKNHILNEIHRASMSLIGEHNLKKCLHKLIRIVIDNANAEKGYLILPNSQNPEHLQIVAEGKANSFETNLEEVLLTEEGPLPLAIINYAIKSRDNIILKEACTSEIFAFHPFIKNKQLKSVLCTPLVYQGNFVGVLYLENNSVTGAFSPFTIELFRLLSAPAAIAIQNAQLYTELETKVLERTKEIAAKNEELERQKNEIQQKNEDILHSINYAKRIQDAFLPKIQDIQNCFKDSFVLYKPKDIVSGDFFWFNQKLSKAIIACADCTGHGIPGAFMSVMANTILRQIVEVEGIFRPDEILELLHMRVRIALQQDETHSRDGMDVAICQLDVKRRKLNYAGANRPLLIIRGKDFAEIKPDKLSVGGDQDEDIRKFTNHSIDLEEKDRIYVFTDGYSDQFSEANHKKYQSKRFYQLLLETRHLSMSEQKEILDKELEAWKAGEPQTDDILVIGIEV